MPKILHNDFNAAYADPPGWAPAWGHRGHDRDDDWDDHKHKKHKHKHHHKEEYVEYDYRPRPPKHIVFESAPQEVCTTNVSNQATLGTILGGITGGILGNQVGKGNGKTAATVGGALLGGVLGNSIGASYTTVDKNCTIQALGQGREGRRTVWQNPDTGASYAVIPTRTFTGDRGAYCREYQSQANVGGRIQETYGTACRQPDGSWKIVQ